MVDDLWCRQTGAVAHAVYQGTTPRGRALWITLDRPDKLNVLHPQDLSELRDVIAGPAPGVQAIVFTGAGQAAFSTGMNIDAFAGLTPARAHALIGDLAQVMRAIRHSPVVTVAAVNGHCLGAAFELALAYDPSCRNPDCVIRPARAQCRHAIGHRRGPAASLRRAQQGT